MRSSCILVVVDQCLDRTKSLDQFQNEALNLLHFTNSLLALQNDCYRCVFKLHLLQGGLNHILNVSKHFLLHRVLNDVKTLAHQKLILKVDAFLFFGRHLVLMRVAIGKNAAVAREIDF